MRRLSVIGGLTVAFAIPILAAVKLQVPKNASSGAPPAIPLVAADVSLFQVVEVTAAGRTETFERAADGRWFHHRHVGEQPEVHQHVPDPRLAGTILEALAGFSSAPASRADVTGGSGALGLQNPVLFVALFQAGSARPVARYLIGDSTDDGNSRYVMNADIGLIVTIPDKSVAGLRGLIAATTADR